MTSTKTTTDNDGAKAQALLELAATLTAAAQECIVAASVITGLPESTLVGLEKRLGALGDACHEARRQLRKPGREVS